VENDPVQVRVANFGDLVFRTEETEPQHFTMMTFTLNTMAQLAVMGQGPQLILAEDPLRKDATLWSVDAPIVVCHSPNQAASAGNQAAGFTAPDGAYLAQGQSLSLSGTGRLYAMCQAPTRVSVAINRRSA
jgi:hypothetical protein